VKGRQIRYSDEELAFIEWRQAMSRRALHAAFVAEFGRADVTLDHIKALCSRRKWNTGRTGCFEKGLVPHNKGKPHPTRGRAAETQFKKGTMNGRARERYQPIGTERVSKDGYIERKVHDGMPLQSRWRMVQHIRWEEVNGPLPAGMVLKSRDGNRQNTDPSNWIAVPRAILPRLAGGPHHQKIAYDDAPADLKPAILAIAELEHAARTRGRRTPA
jgi:hypothetical protein